MDRCEDCGAMGEGMIELYVLDGDDHTYEPRIVCEECSTRYYLVGVTDSDMAVYAKREAYDGTEA
jgi:hypothetical protein